MADRQAQIPGGAYFNDVSEAALYQRQIPGFQYVNETQQTVGVPTAVYLNVVSRAVPTYKQLAGSVSLLPANAAIEILRMPPYRKPI